MPLAPDPQTCVVFLIRHGATASNLAQPPVLQGRSVDGPLSEIGNRQAAEVTAQLAKYPIQAVFCSPLLRARETAITIAAPHQLTPIVVAEIAEVDVGHWERRSWDEIRINEPEAYQNFQDDPATYGYAGGENLNNVRDRVVPSMGDIARRHTGQAIVIVSHNVVNRAFLASVLEMPLSRARNIHQNNCGINILSWRSGEWKVIAVNSIFHLEEDA